MPQRKIIYGLLAEFANPHALLEAARRTRNSGFHCVEAYCPFPIHGLSEALGLKQSRVPLITLIGLSAKNAILIVEFAKVRVDRGEPLLQSTLEAVKLRLRPIVMTSMAFILGVMPLVLASGAGAVARKTIGFAVLGGMVASTSTAIFIVPVLYVLFTKWSYGRRQLEWLQAHHELLMEKARRVELQNIDPELEYEIAQAHAEHKKSTKGLNE